MRFLQIFQSYWSYFYRAFRANTVYRSSLWFGLFSAFLSFLVIFFIWTTVLHSSAARTLPPNLPAYLALAFALNFALSLNVEFRIGQRIRQGWIAVDLLRPVDFQSAQAAQALADGLFNAGLGFVVLAAAAPFLGSTLLPAKTQNLFFFFPSLLLAFLLQFSISFLFVQGAFFTYSHYGVFASRLALHQTFSGLSAPLSLYPPFLQKIAVWLPFQHVLYTPIQIYQSQNTPTHMMSLLIQQALWTAFVFLLGRALFKRALFQLEIQGG